MDKRTIYTNITPLPRQVTREIAVDELHDHGGMIKLNPLVTGFERSSPHKDASADEYHCIWYEITDRVSYLPGIKGQVKYKACFFDRPIGLQTHCFAPAGLDIKAKWSVGGNMPGEPREARELGVDTPRDGLYLREDVDMHCNIMLTGFVKKNLKRAHKVLIDRLVKKVEIVEEGHYRQSTISPSSQSSTISPPATPGWPPQIYASPHSDGSVASNDMYQRASMPPYPGPPMANQQFAPPHTEDVWKPNSPPPQYLQSPHQQSDRRSSNSLQKSPVSNFYPRPQRAQSFAVELPGSESRPVEMYTPPLPSKFGASANPPQELDTRHQGWRR